MMNYVLKHLYLVCGNHGLKNQNKQPNPTNTNHQKGKLWNSDSGNETTGKKLREGPKSFLITHLGYQESERKAHI